MEPNPFFCALRRLPHSESPDPCGHKHRTFAGAASCAVYYAAWEIAKIKVVSPGKSELLDTYRRNIVPPGESDEMLIVKVYNNRRMAYFRDNEGDDQLAIARTTLDPGETEFLSVGCYLRAPWEFVFGHWYALEEAKAHNHVPYLNVDGVDGEEPGYYVDGVRAGDLEAAE